MSDQTDNNKETSSTSSSSVSVPPLLLEGEDSNEGGNGNTLYKYRDFSNMPEEQDAEEDSSSNNNNNRNSLESSIRVQKFPVKLYAILAQKEFHDIITWMPHGRSWKVLKPNLFESMVMPLFFEYSNYHSFNRLVNAWSFRRISSGPDRGSYYHELFLRGKPHLQKYMRRLPKTHKKLPMKKEDEPDFYKMDKDCSLPPLEEIPLSNGPKSVMNNMANAGAGRGGAGAQTQPLAFSPVHAGAQGMHAQRSNGMGLASRMFAPEGVASHDTFAEEQFGRGVNSRSPTNMGMGMSGMPGMRDPTNFGKSMEFKPVSNMDGGHHSMAHPGMMGSQAAMMGAGHMGAGQGMNQMMGAGQMGPGAMMGGHQMGSNMNNMMGAAAGQMGGHQMMGGPNAAMMGGQMGGQMGPGAAGMMSPNAAMMGNQMGGNMNSQHAMNGMGNQMGGANSQQFHNLQRLRQLQQMQLFDQRMGSQVPVGAGGEEGFGRMGSFPRC